MGVGGFGGLVYHRKIRPTQLWVELSWVVAIPWNPRELSLIKQLVSNSVKNTFISGLSFAKD